MGGGTTLDFTQGPSPNCMAVPNVAAIKTLGREDCGDILIGS